MNLTFQDRELLREICRENDVSYDKIIRLLETVRDYEFKERRRGINDALRTILEQSNFHNRSE